MSSRLEIEEVKTKKMRILVKEKQQRINFCIFVLLLLASLSEQGAWMRNLRIQGL